MTAKIETQSVELETLEQGRISAGSGFRSPRAASVLTPPEPRVALILIADAPDLKLYTGMLVPAPDEMMTRTLGERARPATNDELGIAGLPHLIREN